jgi:hypothetical protein
MKDFIHMYFDDIFYQIDDSCLSEHLLEIIALVLT